MPNQVTASRSFRGSRFLVNMKRTATLSQILACLCLTSCAAILRSSHDMVTFTSEPPGAKVYVDSLPLGITPTQLSLLARKDHRIEFRKEGDETKSTTLSSSVGPGWVALDVILAGIIGIIVDAATNSWSGLDEDHLHLLLDKRPDNRKAHNQKELAKSQLFLIIVDTT